MYHNLMVSEADQLLRYRRGVTAQTMTLLSGSYSLVMCIDRISRRVIEWVVKNTQRPGILEY